MPQAFTCGIPLYHSRRQRKLQLDVSRVIAAAYERRAGAAHGFPSACERRSEVRCPAVLEGGTDLERVAGVAVETAALPYQLSADARGMSHRITERHGGATARPHVMAAEIVVREHLSA